MKNSVVINLRKDEIIIKINEKAEQSEIMECLNNKIQAIKKLSQAEETSIYVIGKILEKEEMKEIKDLITSNTGVKVSFDSPKALGLYGIKDVFEKEIKSSETKFHKGSLRCGQKVEFEGSVVILGDVNNGAEVIAGENIVILGELRGLAHAGAKGNKKAIIATNLIESPQIRIANKVREIEKGELENTYKCAFIGNDTIILQ